MQHRVGRNRHERRAITARVSSDSSGRYTKPLLSLTLLHTESHPHRKWSRFYVTPLPVRTPVSGGSEHAGARQLCSRLLCPDTTHLRLSRSVTCVRVPGLASGPRGKAERARREGGVVEVRAQPASPVALPPPDEDRRGKGRSEPGPAAHTRSLLVEGGGAEEKGAPPPLFAAAAKEEESQGPNPPPQAQKLPPPPAPISPETAPRPAPHTRCPNREPQPGRPRLAPPRRPSLRAAECARP